ncbi:MAG: ABC transporter permease [Eubacterium sp.]|nr:ABC transporter permease [Eubacterium sp.]
MVFGTVLDRGDGQFPLYIIGGRLMYSFFSSGTKAAATSIRKNSGMIKKVYVAKYLYPLSSVMFNFIIFLISLLTLIPVAIYTRTLPTHYIWQVIPALAILIMLTLGVGMILATLMVFFRDMEYLWNVVLLLIMYMCAIFYYPEKIIQSDYAPILTFNPVYCTIDIFRGGIMGYQAASWQFVYSFVFGVVVMIIGTILFRSKQDKFILHI